MAQGNQTVLAYTPEVAAATKALYAKVSRVIPEVEWPAFAPLIAEINRLKKERGAVILAHNYQTPEIFHCVADFVGDSLQLAREAAKTDAKIIVQAGVHFMAETSKVLSPDKMVLIPDMGAGCSLAASITGADVRLLREKYPNYPVVTYVNTSADVKAEVDICCTSSNALRVVESLGVDRVIFLPDRFLAQNVQAQTKVQIIAWTGACEVHERFTAEELLRVRADDPVPAAAARQLLLRAAGRLRAVAVPAGQLLPGLGDAAAVRRGHLLPGQSMRKYQCSGPG
jgi:quinolinate synthase